MNKSVRKTASGRQVELIIRQLDSLSTLPEVAAGFLAKLADGGIDRSGLSRIIESDAGLSAKILSLAYQEQVVFSGDKPSVSEAVAKLDKSLIREAVLSGNVSEAFGADSDGRRKQLALHGLAVACCAGDIAEVVLGAEQRQLAYIAGLLHDIGKLALDEVMPKSFDRMVTEAESQKASLQSVEQKHLGTDHTVVGRRLGQKWNLPEEIVLAIWLHHSDPATISQNLPGADIAGIVRLADLIVRQCEIGMSGSCDSVESIGELAESFSLSSEHIAGIRAGLPGQVRQRSEFLGLGVPGGAATYCNLIGETAAKLAHDNNELTATNRQLLTSEAHANFVNDFLSGVNANMSAIDVATVFASGWQRHYQTGAVCVYICDEQEDGFEAVVVAGSGRAEVKLVEQAQDISVLPDQLGKEFSISEAGEATRSLLEQFRCEFGAGRTKTAPLIAGARVIGGIVFEQRGPGDPSKQLDAFGRAASAGAQIIAAAMARGRQEELAERFAELLGELRQARSQLARSKSLAAISEMAAGAAHELNNPLAVISGRVQLLYDSEGDGEKKQMLKQIQERSEEISLIVSDLMSFARPAEPAAKMISVQLLIDEAVGRAAKARKMEGLEAEFTSIDELGEVYVDSEQVVTAIANILSNALESYPDGAGAIKIDGGCAQSQVYAAFAIIDSGRGMDAETLAKATEPFFSARPAGRQRGMGLAHAQRLLELNKGSLHLASRVEEGTVVTIRLPRGE
ncbi:MAG: HDOD domain-containing protein [Planctomycetota bacterium]|jgi:putative nucleotidyltransferase with HDIG domain